MKNISVRSKIILTLLLTGLSCLAVSGIVGYIVAQAALKQSVEQSLIAQRESKRRQIENYIRAQLRYTAAIGGSNMVADATRAFISAHDSMALNEMTDLARQKADKAALEAWYQKELMPRLDKVAGGGLQLDALLPTDPVGQRLQADYIVRNPNPIGRKNELIAAPGDSPYDRVHARFHPSLNRFMNAVGFYDINIVDAATGNVVYTTMKEVDIGSNIFTGPNQRSGFTKAARRAMDLANGGKPVIEDYSAYMPSGFAPQIFTAVPVISEGETIGVFVAQIDVATLNARLTDDGQWQASGQGETGEVQLIGEDHLSRSQWRGMATDPKTFLAEVEANGTPQEAVAKMSALGTTILQLPDHSLPVDKALRNQTGVDRFVGVRGVEIVAAYGPVQVAGLHWAIKAAKDASEAFAPLQRLNRDLLIAAGLAVILLTFLALASAGLFLRPLRRIVASMQSVAGASATGAAPAPIAVDERDNGEFAELGKGYNAMAAEIARRGQMIAEAERKVEALMLTLYPAGLAEKLRTGAQVSAETVGNVTVAVTWMGGLDALAVDRNAEEMNEVLNTLLDALKSSGAALGIEMVRSVGETHIAVCGLSSPRLDHADRMLAWTNNAAMAVQNLSTDWAKSITLQFGMASGEIDVLLLTQGHTAYDIWGRPLSVARRLAVEATPGHVRVDESTFRLLKNVAGFEDCPPIENALLGGLRTLSRPIAGPATAPRSSAAE